MLNELVLLGGRFSAAIPIPLVERLAMIESTTDGDAFVAVTDDPVSWETVRGLLGWLVDDDETLLVIGVPIGLLELDKDAFRLAMIVSTGDAPGAVVTGEYSLLANDEEDDDDDDIDARLDEEFMDDVENAGGVKGISGFFIALLEELISIVV